MAVMSLGARPGLRATLTVLKEQREGPGGSGLSHADTAPRRATGGIRRSTQPRRPAPSTELPSCPPRWPCTQTCGPGPARWMGGGGGPLVPLTACALPPAGTLLFEGLSEGPALSEVSGAEGHCRNLEMTLWLFSFRPEDLPVPSLLRGHGVLPPGAAHGGVSAGREALPGRVSTAAGAVPGAVPAAGGGRGGTWGVPVGK